MEEVQIVVVPSSRHDDERCKESKKKELHSFELCNVYEEVQDRCQATISCEWHIVEKENEKLW